VAKLPAKLAKLDKMATTKRNQAIVKLEKVFCGEK
jgi:hypothetical protein